MKIMYEQKSFYQIEAHWTLFSKKILGDVQYLNVDL
jgi:hypothetical protein